MGHHRRVEHAGSFQFDGVIAQLVEQPDASPEQYRDDVKLDLVEEPLGCGG